MDPTLVGFLNGLLFLVGVIVGACIVAWRA